MARFTRIIKIYIFILTPGRRTGEILVEQTDGKNDPSDQSSPRCACAPGVNYVEHGAKSLLESIQTHATEETHLHLTHPKNQAHTCKPSALSQNPSQLLVRMRRCIRVILSTRAIQC